MVRRHNTDRNGNSWSETMKKLVWNKGRIIPNYSSEVWRWDKCGKVMKYSEHGNRSSDHGWEIDHINPVANGGSDDLNNLQPLNWANNLDKSDKLYWTCPL
ncbi:MAG: HNH endonuclease signature motif containing protein [Paludibacter sp.]|nr:HNH endonuclease signature motif containing protein [Paludibacter sp.]